MGVLARILGLRGGRLRGVTAEARPEAEAEPQVPRPPDTAGTPRLERPAPTPSMHVPAFDRTPGTPGYEAPRGTPSTQRLHNPRRHGR